jgi:PAS domain S-box-containing protein
VSVAHKPEVIDRIIAEAHRNDSGVTAVVATDVAGVIVYWNNRATELYGWDAAETIGRNVLDVMPTRQTQDEAAQIMESLRAGNPWSGDFILRHRTGSPVLMHVTDVPVLMAGVVIGIVGMSRPERRNSPRSIPRVPG